MLGWRTEGHYTCLLSCSLACSPFPALFQSYHLGKAHYLLCAVLSHLSSDLSEEVTILLKEEKRGGKGKMVCFFLTDSINFRSFTNGDSMCHVISTGNIGMMGRVDI